MLEMVEYVRGIKNKAGKHKGVWSVKARQISMKGKAESECEKNKSVITSLKATVNIAKCLRCQKA